MTKFLGGETVAKFIVPDWGDKVNSGIGYWPARLHTVHAVDWLAGTTTPSQGQ